MTARSSIQTCLPLNRSFDCDSSVQINEEVESELNNKGPKWRFSRGNALLRKQINKSFVFHSQRTCKRRFTFSGNPEQKVIFKKRRRFNSVALPTKFLLGGNIKDPLNLRSLEDEKVNQQLNAFSPASSPVPLSRHRTQVQVLIPNNIYDPLNLNTGEEIGFNLLTSKPRKRRRHRKSRRDDVDSFASLQLTTKQESLLNKEVDVVKNAASSNDSFKTELHLDLTPCYSEDRVQVNKIVSPVVPQGPSVKFKRSLSKNLSKDTDEKSIQKQSQKKQHLEAKSNFVKSKNAKRFRYGNHFVHHKSLETDQRLQHLNSSLFCGKNVLDIGCNSGALTLYIAKNHLPKSVTGVDIDEKLICLANKKVQEVKSQNKSENLKFPKSMASLYGQLTKVNFIDKKMPTVFPNNVTFLTANYVPACEEFLETQKPEFDVILCLRVTKWIHLNFGDAGLKLAFKRMYAQLRYGGCLILEPQLWLTYSTSKKITPSMYHTYKSLELKPDSFCKYLLSEEVGFSSCELIGKIYNCTKVYRQPLYILTKGFQTSYHQTDALSPVHPDQWVQNSDEGASENLSDPKYLSS